MDITVTLQAGQAQEYFERGDFLRIMDAQAAVTVIFYRNGAEVSRAVNVVEGYAERFSAGDFDKVRIESATTNTVHFGIRLGQEISYDKAPTGDVNVLNFPPAPTPTPVNGAFSHSVVAVATSNVQLLAANANRRYLLVQNNDSVVDVWVRVDGVAATLGGGVRLLAGGSTLELQGFVPTGAINAIGTNGGTANLQVIEG